MSILINRSTPGVIAFDPKVDIAAINQPLCISYKGDIDGDGKQMYTGNKWISETFLFIEIQPTNNSVKFCNTS
ncbi:MAG: hypothetical protein IPG02_05540 [Ignavibacteria bacterium]|nr:hypothetical protein [Ignavibacteria bacterium]